MHSLAPPGQDAHRPPVRIDVSRGWSDCEDCGSYDWATAKLTAAGKTVMAAYDGHLGGGNWCGSEAVLYLWALRMLGVDLRVDGQPVLGHPYYTRAAGQDWQEEHLCPEPRHIVDILVSRRPDPDLPEETAPEYMLTVSASWTARDGTSRTVHVDQGWDGEVGGLYKLLLEEHARVKVRKSGRG